MYIVLFVWFIDIESNEKLWDESEIKPIKAFLFITKTSLFDM